MILSLLLLPGCNRSVGMSQLSGKSVWNQGYKFLFMMRGQNQVLKPASISFKNLAGVKIILKIINKNEHATHGAEYLTFISLNPQNNSIRHKDKLIHVPKLLPLERSGGELPPDLFSTPGQKELEGLPCTLCQKQEKTVSTRSEVYVDYELDIFNSEFFEKL